MNSRCNAGSVLGIIGSPSQQLRLLKRGLGAQARTLARRRGRLRPGTPDVERLSVSCRYLRTALGLCRYRTAGVRVDPAIGDARSDRAAWPLGNTGMLFMPAAIELRIAAQIMRPCRCADVP